MKRLTILTLLFLSSLINANETRTLVSIDYRSQIGNTIALIALSDDSVWKWTPDTYSENLLRKWSQGDQIIISASNCPGYTLHNLSRPHYSPTVALSFNSYLLFPSITEIDTDHSTLSLSDGSQWTLIFDFNQRTLLEWTREDRVVPVKGETNNFELINLDIPFESRCQAERSMQVQPTE